MKRIKVKLSGDLNFRLFIGFALLLFVFRLFFTTNEMSYLLILNEVIVLLTAVSLIIYLMGSMRSQTINPLSMVINVGILSAVIFFLITFSDSVLIGLFGDVSKRMADPGLIFNLVITFYVFIILSSIAYIFIVFKELYFLKQRKNVNVYFNTMMVSFVLASVSSVFNKLPDYKYIETTFFIIAVLLIIINSLRISWIAFIVKKEKITLLILSVVISILFIVNLVSLNSSKVSVHNQILLGYSASLYQFLNLILIYGAIYFSILFFTTLFHIPTAEAFDRKAQEVSSFQYFSKLITQVLDFNDLIKTITDIATTVSNSDSAWIVIIEEKKIKTYSPKNISKEDADLVNNYILESGKINLSETIFSLPLDILKNNINLRKNFTYALAVQLKALNNSKGYLVVARINDYIFDEEDRNAVETFSDYASLAIENSKLLKESIEKERLEKELDVAREIQRKILPAANPKYDKLSIASVFIPAFETGGDYYDFFDIEGHKLGFVIADVSGKGISAAFIMSEIKGIFESLSKTIESPKEILIKTNQILERSLDRKSFVSAVYGLIDMEKNSLCISRAGHCPVVLLRNNMIENIRPLGMGLGLDFGNHFSNTLEEVKINLQDNDVVILYTDGITEAKNAELQDFGTDNFENLLLNINGSSAKEIADRVIHEVTSFAKDSSQHDDITLLILKWKLK